MARSLLVGLEESAGTDRATALALEIAQAQGARLMGLTIIDEPDITAGAAMGIGGSSYKQDRDKILIEEAHRRAHEAEELFLHRCRKASVPARVLEITGRPAETILEEMQHHDLVFLGRDANFQFETQATDNRTWDLVLHRASRPVIVVPEQEVARSNTVVLAYDGSVAATGALRAFVASGLAREHRLHVVTVDASGAAAWEIASEGVQNLEELGFKAELHNVVTALPLTDALLQTAGQIGADLIVMGAFAHSRLRHLFRGSVTQQLVERTTIPLFLTH
ncbi:MAG TPA: universal stress protein [Polyangia bacterium]|jgi:nucleotide-binding universal stress UspA family protein|nr:universal stress protein [Polyangia bacterium]